MQQQAERERARALARQQALAGELETAGATQHAANRQLREEVRWLPCMGHSPSRLRARAVVAAAAAAAVTTLQLASPAVGRPDLAGMAMCGWAVTAALGTRGEVTACIRPVQRHF